MEPLSGYLLLTQRFYEAGPRYAKAWNFGSSESDAKTVEWFVERLVSSWGGDADYEIDHGEHPHEAHYLKLDCSKAKSELDWYSRWNLEPQLK